MFRYRHLFTAVLSASTLSVAAQAQDGPKNATVLIIRHAEVADSGHGLSSRGEERAKAYKDYFLNFAVDSKRRNPHSLPLGPEKRRNRAAMRLPPRKMFRIPTDVLRWR